MTRARRSALVVGGGVAGLATGLALQRTGWDVRVRERSAELERGGAGLVLWPNALRCLRVLGIHDEVRALGTVLVESRLARTDGRPLSRVGLAMPDADGALGVVRADLVDTLARALEPGTLELGSAVADARQVTAEDMGVDLVVGADGLRSFVRTAWWPGVQPVHRGCTVWRALLAREDHDGTWPAGLTETWGRGVRFGTVPVGPASTYVYAAARTPAAGDGEDDLARLHRVFGSWHEPIPALLDRLQPGGVLRHDVHDLPPGAAPLAHGRHALVGDAAHAMEPNLGQGACLALEDAVVLAHSLTTSSSTEAGLATYAGARAGRVASLARRSRQVGLLAAYAHPWGVAARDVAMSLTPDRAARRAVRDAAGWQPPLAAPVTRTASP